MNENTQVVGGRRVSVPVREREQADFVYFRIDSHSLNVARPDGKRITFLKGWYKTRNAGDISYLRELAAEQQIGIWEHKEPTAELEFSNTLSGAAAELEKIESQIAADPRFAAAVQQMLQATQGKQAVADQLQEAAQRTISARISSSETSGMALQGVSNSQSLAAGASISQSEAEKQETAVDTKIASGAALSLNLQQSK